MRDNQGHEESLRFRYFRICKVGLWIKDTGKVGSPVKLRPDFTMTLRQINEIAYGREIRLGRWGSQSQLSLNGLG